MFIQVGTNEGDDMDAQYISNMNQAYINSSLYYYQALLRTFHPIDNIRLKIMANETHHEVHWANHFVEFLSFSLMGNRRAKKANKRLNFTIFCRI
ncbi:putative esterase [Actinobacillus equuli]|nr:putative esterase [Actinobacillus equuli]